MYYLALTQSTDYMGVNNPCLAQGFSSVSIFHTFVIYLVYITCLDLTTKQLMILILQMIKWNDLFLHVQHFFKYIIFPFLRVFNTYCQLNHLYELLGLYYKSTIKVFGSFCRIILICFILLCVLRLLTFGFTSMSRFALLVFYS